MLDLIKNIEFVKYKNLEVKKIDDKKFILSNEKNSFILNLFPFGKFEKIKKNFYCLNELSNSFSNIPYEEVNILNDKFCYRIIPLVFDEKYSLDKENSYKIGFHIGKFIYNYHSLFQSVDCGRWSKHYNYRINKFLHNYGIGNYRGNLDYVIFDFLKKNKCYLEERTCTNIIGINGLNDIIISKDGRFQIIEEYKILKSDAYFEFRNMSLYYENNENLLTGMINGYFNNNVPRIFFKLLGVYTIVENLYDVFVEGGNLNEEFISEKIKNINYIYDYFSNIYPIWYLR